MARERKGKTGDSICSLQRSQVKFLHLELQLPALAAAATLIGAEVRSGINLDPIVGDTRGRRPRDATHLRFPRWVRR